MPLMNLIEPLFLLLGPGYPHHPDHHRGVRRAGSVGAGGSDCAPSRNRHGHLLHCGPRGLDAESAACVPARRPAVLRRLVHHGRRRSAGGEGPLGALYRLSAPVEPGPARAPGREGDGRVSDRHDRPSLRSGARWFLPGGPGDGSATPGGRWDTRPTGCNLARMAPRRRTEGRKPVSPVGLSCVRLLFAI
jgi:hypothetical protein